MSKNKLKSQIVADTVVNVLSEKGEKIMLDEVADNLLKIAKKENKENELKITSAIKLPVKEKKKIQKYFKGILKRELTFNNIVDPDIIGGLKIEWGDFLLDLTLKGRIKNIAKHL